MGYAHAREGKIIAQGETNEATKPGMIQFSTATAEDATSWDNSSADQGSFTMPPNNLDLLGMDDISFNRFMDDPQAFYALMSAYTGKPRIHTRDQETGEVLSEGDIAKSDPELFSKLFQQHFGDAISILPILYPGGLFSYIRNNIWLSTPADSHSLRRLLDRMRKLYWPREPATEEDKRKAVEAITNALAEARRTGQSLIKLDNPINLLPLKE